MNQLPEKVNVLDKGFIKVIDYLPRLIPEGYTADYAVVEAARVSYNKGLKTPEEDKKLLRYLYEHKHFSPFEMAHIKFHIKCPIFVARQWMRHRNGSFNEISGRFVELKNEYYIPEIENIKEQSSLNKQSTGNKVVTSLANKFLEVINKIRTTFIEYDTLVSQGLAREQARIILPVSTYTEFYWYVNLRSLLNFIELRNSPHAQDETREYAKVINNIAKQIFPWTMEAFEDFTLNSITFTKEDVENINRGEYNIFVSKNCKLSERKRKDLERKVELFNDLT